MADPAQILGNRVYCHLCRHEWDRSQGGLQCPECDSEFVEILEPDTVQDNPSSPPEIPPHPVHHLLTRSAPPIPQHPLHNHNPWANIPDPDEDDITTFEFNTGRGRGTFSYSSRTFTFGSDGRGHTFSSSTRGRDPAADEIARNFESMLSGIMGGGRDAHRPPPTMFAFPNQQNRGFARQSPGAPTDLFSMLFSSLQPTGQQARQGHPLDFLSMLFNPANAQHGDAVFTQEAFDRVMTQLMEQNQGSGAPPASEAAIGSLKKKPLDKTMMGSDGTAECSICMDNVEVGDEVTFLPCNHWFHGDCVVSWLKEHDTCPHCRKPITDAQEEINSPRRNHRRSSSRVVPDVQENASRYGPQVMNSPNRDQNRSERDSDSQGGVGGWIRNHMPF